MTRGTEVLVLTGSREREATVVADRGETIDVIFDGGTFVLTYPAAAVVEDDAMDAPSDWDSGSVSFDPYV